MSVIIHFARDEGGATAIEYGLIAAALGGVLITALPTLRNAISTKFKSLGTGITNFT